MEYPVHFGFMRSPDLCAQLLPPARPSSPVIQPVGGKATEAPGAGPIAQVTEPWYAPYAPFVQELPSLQERLDYVIARGYEFQPNFLASGGTLSSERLPMAAWPGCGDPFPPVPISSQTWWYFLAKWWLYGVPARCPDLSPEPWIEYRGHLIRRQGSRGFNTARRYDLMLTIDLIHNHLDTVEGYTWDGEPFGQLTAEAVQGGDAAFLLMNIDEFGSFGGLMIDRESPSTYESIDGLANLVESLEFPAGSSKRYLILLSRSLWPEERTAPGELPRQPLNWLGIPQAYPVFDGFLLPRINGGLAHTLRSTPSLSPNYLNTLTANAPFLEAVPAARDARWFLFEAVPNVPLLGWLKLVETVAHELFHVGMCEAGVDSGDPPNGVTRICDAATDPREFAQTGECLVSAHAMVRYAGAEVAEVAVYGQPSGWLANTLCCVTSDEAIVAVNRSPGIPLDPTPADYDPADSGACDACP